MNMNVLANLGSILSRNWWLMLLRGIVAIGFGILIFAKPQISLQVLVYLFGAYALVEGTLGLWVAAQASKDIESWWVLLLWGLLGIAVGILAFVKPGITALALLFYIAIWAIATGVLEIVAAVRLRQLIKDEWLLILAGLASLAFGVALIVQPEAGALAVLWLIGAYAIVFGLLIVIFAFKIRSFVGKVTRLAS
ncbi:MAG: HdeD family acid-resistance protein [Steroidobacteraceae bacterium]